MKFNTIKRVGRSDFVNMGPIQLRQPIPTQDIEMVDPFILLHHYGPYQIDEENNPFDLGPHPHRGFEPITFLIQGERDGHFTTRLPQKQCSSCRRCCG